MTTKELVEYLEKTLGDKLTKADEEIIQHLRLMDEITILVNEIVKQFDEIKGLLSE